MAPPKAGAKKKGDLKQKENFSQGSSVFFLSSFLHPADLPHPHQGRRHSGQCLVAQGAGQAASRVRGRPDRFDHRVRGRRELCARRVRGQRTLASRCAHALAVQAGRRLLWIARRGGSIRRRSVRERAALPAAVTGASGERARIDSRNCWSGGGRRARKVAEQTVSR